MLRVLYWFVCDHCGAIALTVLGLTLFYVIFGIPTRLIWKEEQELGTAAVQDLGNYIKKIIRRFLC